MKVLAAVRIHRKNVKELSSPVDLSTLKKLVLSAPSYCDQVAIAFPADDLNLTNALNAEFGAVSHISLVPVSDWGNFIPALNALLLFAAAKNFDCILYQSVEAVATREIVDVLISHLSEDTLVVGKCFKDHRFQPPSQPLDGVTAPWNTLAIWSVKKLALTGFLLVAEGFHDVAGGVEEVSVIALLQTILPDSSKAKLIRMKQDAIGDGWITDWTDAGRKEWHTQKMASKLSRPAAHLKLLHLTGHGIVDHIEH
ncbi:hypothetical protein SmJEL517_g05885 [Synchytrium microbalum]|uniref:Uncharacterized protein n=1 Tax=Synchytrium microbalum TaxID=1806994 RepID=A0A507BTI1_9FUNG|nr:uncharacterized protein SmJEL517_g05885 [Synchytrium microbalum]TPX30581.1 hypothetical protein SmJEL517_g05885 [Synchytrium microbalum]